MPFSSTAVLKKLIEERVPDLRLQNAKTLSYLSARGQVKAGTNSDLYWDVINAGSTVVGAPMTTAGVNQNTGNTVQAALSIGGSKYYHQFSVLRTDMKNAQAAGVGKLRQLFRLHIDAGILEIRRKVNQSIWTGDGTDAHGGIVGMQRVLAAASPYANLDPATITNWVPIVDSNATARALSRDLLYNLTRIQQEQEVSTDVYFISPTMAQTYQKLFDTIAGQYSIAGVEGSGRNTDLGYNVMSYQGCPVLTDPMAPSGQFVGFMTSAVELITYDLSNADQGELKALGQKDNFETISSADVDGLRVNVALLPETNPGQVTFQMFVVPQLRVTNRRMVQGITNLL